MRTIRPELLWIGNARDARTPQALYDHGIQCVVELAYEEQSAVLPRDFVTLRVPLVDGGGNPPELLETAVGFVALCLGHKRRTLVTCSAGMSRSPAIVAAAMSRDLGITLIDALDLVRSNGP